MWLTGALVCQQAAPRIQLSASIGKRWPHYHQLSTSETVKCCWSLVITHEVLIWYVTYNQKITIKTRALRECKPLPRPQSEKLPFYQKLDHLLV